MFENSYMINHLVLFLTNFVIHTISTLGYGGVILLMAVESAAIPLPSEIIMPFAGFLVSQGRFSLFGIALAGAVGNVLGSMFTYWLGYKGGRPLFEKYGKYILVSHHDINIADKFFAKYGSLSSFLGRLLPVMRTFISVPAGIFREPFKKFLFYSFVGSFFWSLFLGFLGMKLGQNWGALRDKFHNLDTAIIILIILGAIWWVWRHIKHRRHKS